VRIGVESKRLKMGKRKDTSTEDELNAGMCNFEMNDFFTFDTCIMVSAI
jgi:hypothetical protein